jgi:hypothetical protein
MVAALLLGVVAPSVALGAVDTSQPTSTVKYVFVHHSTGDAWLQDSYGGLAASLGANNYFVSDTNYGWGPSAIGDHTDVGDWWTWFRGPSAATYTAALYSNTGVNSSYARSLSNPGGENTVVMFKSCFPNSNVGGSAADPIPAIGSNPLAGHGMTDLTVGNAKGVYLDLLEYFKLHPDKLFVLIVSPPLRSADTGSDEAANARALANWLVDPSGLLNGYSAGNVFVYDYYTVLTGGHHRVVSGAIEHTPGPSNYLAYPTGDSHPSAAGDQIATAEFVPMLNAAYNAWRAGSVATGTPVDFPDASLDTAVRSAIGKPSGQIYASELATLTSLSADSAGIARLDGLEHATHLQSLHLTDSTITTLTPLQGLTSLTDLDLNNNNISDVAPLSGLTNLTELALYHNHISDISALSALLQLHTLYLGQNQITDVSALSSLTALDDLALDRMSIPDISPLAELSNLTRLDLFENDPLADISPIAHLTRLNYLNVAGCRIYDISPLGTLAGASPNFVILNGNWIDLTAGSQSAATVAGLSAKGYTVVTDPAQRVGGAVLGWVRSVSGSPLSGVTIALANGPRALTAADGTYTIGLAEPGTRTITFSKPYYLPHTATVRVDVSTTATVNASLVPTQLPLVIKRSPSGSSLTYKRRRGVARFTLGATLSDARGRVGGAWVWLQKSSNGRKWSNVVRLRSNSAGTVAKGLSAKKKGVTYYRWYAPATASDRAAATLKQRVRVK